MKRFFLPLLFLCTLPVNAQLAWNAQNSNVGTIAVKDIFFKNTTEGFGVCENGLITRTTDGGANWIAQTAPVSFTLYSISFSTGSIGWIVGNNATILKTTDGGSTWGIVAPPGGSTSHFYDVQFVDENHGWILGFTQNFRTTDGGASWSSFDPTGVGNTCFDMHFLDANYGWVGGQAGFLAHTSDGGQNWTQVTPLWSSDIYAVYAKSADELFIAGSGYIHSTINGGADWNVHISGFSNALVDMDFMDDQVGVAVGNGGTTYVTADNGVTWTQNFYTGCDMASVDLVGNGIGWVSGYCGEIYKTNYGIIDLQIDQYVGLDTLCSGTDVPLNLILKNYGFSPATEATFVFIFNSSTIHTFSWTGYIAPNASDTIYMNTVSVDQSGYYTGVISGDSIPTNNTSIKYIEVIDGPGYTSGLHSICAGDSVIIEAFGGDQYTWIGLGGDSLSASQMVSPTETQQYYVNIKTNLCNKTDSVKVEVLNCEAPVTAISPNGDGVNDVLELSTIPSSENYVRIYNRWGDLVNSFTNYDNETVVWDGTDYVGKPLTEGTYYYIFDSADYTIHLDSWVQIIR